MKRKEETKDRKWYIKISNKGVNPYMKNYTQQYKMKQPPPHWP